jgi:hypothetical protein
MDTATGFVSTKVGIMSDQVFKLYTTQFSTNLELKLQQLGSKLRGKVSEGFHVGKQASPVQEMGPITLQTPAGRFAPIRRQDADFTRRWVFPVDGEISQLIDNFDLLKTIIDPKSQYLTNAGNAVGRGWDDAIIASAFAASQVGTDNGALSPENFDTTKYVVADDFGASQAVGLSVAKLIEAKRIFRHNHVDLETDAATVIVGSQQESDMLNNVQFVSTEYNDHPVLVDGHVKRFMGFDIVVSERLNTVSGDRQCIAFVKSGLYLGVWQDTINDVSIRKDLSSLPYQLYTKVSFGATRLQQGKVLRIDCLDATGADITP